MKVLNNKTKLFESDGNKDSRYYINRIIDLLEFNRMFGKTNQEILNKIDRKSTRLNSSHIPLSRMPSSA